jgi:hypothetical protein
MRALGRLLQHLALLLPPLSILLQLTGALSTKQMLVALIAALSMFYLGRLLEGYARR